MNQEQDESIKALSKEGLEYFNKYGKLPSTFAVPKQDYERPRCKILLSLPFGLFIAKEVIIPQTEGALVGPAD